MRKKLALALLVSLVIFAVPAMTTSSTASVGLSVDDFLLTGIVTTELVAAVKCPVDTLTCSQVDADCGVIRNVCHCKAGGVGGTILVCVKNPGDGGGGPVE